MLLHVRGRNFGVRGSDSAQLFVADAPIDATDVEEWSHRTIRAWASAFDVASVAVRANGHTSNVVTAAWRCAPSCALAMLGDRTCHAECNERACGFDCGDCELCGAGTPLLRLEGLRYSVREDVQAAMASPLRAPGPKCLCGPLGSIGLADEPPAQR